MNFVDCHTALGERTYAVPPGMPVPLSWQQDALDQLPGFYRVTCGKFKAVLKRPVQDEKEFDGEGEAREWLSMRITRGY